MVYLIILISLIISTITGISICFFIRNKKATTTIQNTFNKLGKLTSSKKIYDYCLETETDIYLFKIIYNYNNSEISLNSKNHWRLNSSVVSSKNGGVKIEDIYDLVNKDDFNFEKPYKKIYIVYPSSRVLVKAVNESELTFITPEMDCYGVNVVKFTEIQEYIEKNKIQS